MTTAQQIQPGTKARIQLPNWDGPGAIRYTIKSVNDERGTVTMEAPDLPGGSIVGPTVPISQVVPA
jgi:hypothetical protein